ncbi:MAG: ABC transporter ATP-binding protein [Propionibacteriaceae bacterium]|nr:ABC transporter ATP-binding protein [Propionibacteriaceae bacterium]
MSNALEIQNLCKSYPGFKLDSVSFALPMGKIMGFVGQNGAGKTTTIRTILNMATRDSGEVHVFGLDNIADELAIKQELGAVFDEIFFVDSWRIREVEKVVRGFYRGWDTALFAQFLDEFELTTGKRVRELSRGMKMKLMLAVAMSHGAKLLILDEPTSGLDPVARDELLDILQRYISDGERSVFFSTHITSDLERVAEYITVIEHGKIFYTGTKDGLLDHFLIIRGDRSALTADLTGQIIGAATTSVGFTGMIRASDATGLPPGLETVTPTIDEILVHISKGGINKHA